MKNEFVSYNLLYKGGGIYVYTESRKLTPISRKEMATQASGVAEVPLTLIYRNCPDLEVRNYVLQETELYEALLAKRLKKINK